MTKAAASYSTTCMLEVRSLQLLPQHAGRQLTIKDKARSIFRSSELPVSCFNLIITQPSVMEFPRNRLDFSVRLEHLPKQSTAPLNPAVTIKSFRADVFSYTRSRTETKYEDNSANRLAFTPTHFQLGLFSAAEKWTKHHACGFPPGMTISLTRAYRLKVKVVVVCAGRTLEVKMVHPLAFTSTSDGVQALNKGYLSSTTRTICTGSPNSGAQTSHRNSPEVMGGDRELPNTTRGVREKENPPSYTA